MVFQPWFLKRLAASLQLQNIPDSGLCKIMKGPTFTEYPPHVHGLVATRCGTSQQLPSLINMGKQGIYKLRLVSNVPNM